MRRSFAGEGGEGQPLTYDFSVITEKGVNDLLGFSLPAPSIMSWHAEIDEKRFSGMIEIDGSFWADLARTKRNIEESSSALAYKEIKKKRRICLAPEGQIFKFAPESIALPQIRPRTC